MKGYFSRVCLVLLFIFMFSVLVFGEKVENVKIEILEWGNNGVIYKITNNDTVPIKWYKVRMTLEYEEDRIVGSTNINNPNNSDIPIYGTVKRQKHVYDYGPDNPIEPGETVQVFFKFPPVPTSNFIFNENTVKITCNSEPKDFPSEPSNLKIKPAVWIAAILIGLLLAFK